jgi:hypothetical protein
MNIRIVKIHLGKRRHEKVKALLSLFINPEPKPFRPMIDKDMRL